MYTFIIHISNENHPAQSSTQRKLNKKKKIAMSFEFTSIFRFLACALIFELFIYCSVFRCNSEIFIIDQSSVIQCSRVQCKTWNTKIKCAIHSLSIRMSVFIFHFVNPFPLFHDVEKKNDNGNWELLKLITFLTINLRFP